MRSVSVAFGVTMMLFAAQAAPAGELDGGGWCGTWTAINKGDGGPLRARFQEIDSCHYRVVFTGKFAKVVPFRFKTTLNIVGHEGDKVILAGEARVAVFGKFSYHALADAHSFHATYDSRGWRGEFNLSR